MKKELNQLMNANQMKKKIIKILKKEELLLKIEVCLKSYTKNSKVKIN